MSKKPRNSLWRILPSPIPIAQRLQEPNQIQEWLVHFPNAPQKETLEVLIRPLPLITNPTQSTGWVSNVVITLVLPNPA